jgi:hypothetical protein
LFKKLLITEVVPLEMEVTIRKSSRGLPLNHKKLRAISKSGFKGIRPRAIYIEVLKPLIVEESQLNLMPTV